MARFPRFLRTGCAAAMLVAAVAVGAQTIELGEAPRRFESQDTTGWSYPVIPKSAKTRADVALGVQGVAAIDLYVDDSGAGNTATGHRRWVLFPPRTAMATGDVPGGNQPPRPANALYVFGPSCARPATPNGIAWPPAGFV